MAKSVRELVVRIISGAMGIPSKEITDDMPLNFDICDHLVLTLMVETDIKTLQVDFFDTMTVGKFIAICENAA